MAAMNRLMFYQEASDGAFACSENAVAMNLLRSAHYVLLGRTKRRKELGVEGTHVNHE